MFGFRVLTIVSLLIALALGAASVALAVDPQDYYSFRVSSALPGMLFGVTPDGQPGFAGAFQQNIPVAYTPANGGWVLGGNSGSNSSSIELGFSGEEVNGTAFLGAGLGEPGHGFWIARESTASRWGEEAWNAQYQVLKGSESRPAIAVGVQDALNERERFNPRDHHNARSFYVTATGPISQATWRPAYWTAGIGNGRFRRGFLGVTVPVSDHVRLLGEYDSFNPNAGVAWGLNGLDTEKKWDVMGYFGYTDLKRPVVALTMTYNR